MNPDTTIPVPSWAAVATLVALIVQLVTVAAALNSLVKSQREAGKWTGTIDENLRQIRETLDTLRLDGSDLRERVARHGERLAQHETRIDHLEAMHHPDGSDKR